MDVAAIIIAIVAILVGAFLAGFGILIQFLTHKTTTEQSERVASSVAQFRADMEGLVGELKGMTHTLVEAQQQQFNRMLDAFVTRPGAAEEVAESATRSAVSVEEVRTMLDGLRVELEKAAGGAPVPDRLAALESRLDELRDSTVAAARLAERALARRPGPDLGEAALRTTDVDAFVERVAPRLHLRVSPRQIAAGQSVALEALGWLPAGDMEHLTFVVRNPRGMTAAVGLAPDLKWGRRPRVVYPDDFLDSSTEQAGEYAVTVRSRGTGITAHSAFLVVPVEHRP
jgi:hypothetical protein